MKAVTKKSSASGRLALLLATGGGTGYSPVSPGTLGALESVALYGLIAALPLGAGARAGLIAGLALLSFVAGVWAASRACEVYGLQDPQVVNIDEICGQLLALLPVAASPSLWRAMAAFALFRAFDIFKPFPIRRFEHLPGGYGVMTDDVIAGIYAAALVWAGAAAGLY